MAIGQSFGPPTLTPGHLHAAAFAAASACSSPRAESSCSGKRTCDVRVFGLVFPDPVCFVIINNRNTDIVATMQASGVWGEVTELLTTRVRNLTQG